MLSARALPPLACVPPPRHLCAPRLWRPLCPPLVDRAPRLRRSHAPASGVPARPCLKCCCAPRYGCAPNHMLNKHYKNMIIHAYQGIKDFISMHVIIFMCIFLSFHEKDIIISKLLSIRVKSNDLKINNLITHLYLRL